MPQLEDTRPHVFRELQIDPGAEVRESGPYAVLVGRLVGELLDSWPDVDLPTIRLWQHEHDGVPTIRIDARRGPLPGVDCPQCHQPVGREHTDYCTLAPGKVWDGVLPDAKPAPRLVCRRCNGYGLVLIDRQRCPCPDCARP